MKMKKLFRIFSFAFAILFMLPSTVFADEHEHNMVEDFKAPTCTQEGYYNYYCSICGFSPDGLQVLPKTEHNVESWISDKPAFCISYGKEHGYCSECSTLIYRSVEPNGKHMPKTIYSYPSTTRSDGEVLVRCALCNQTLEKTVIYRIKMISLDKGSYEYNNKPHKPNVKVFDRKGNEIQRENFSVKYDKNTKSVGTHRVRIVFLNHYEAEEVLTYRIIPKRTSIKNLSAKKGAAEIKIAKLPKEAEGYQISYSTDKDFNKTKTITINDSNQLTHRIRKLKSKKKYYFRVRTFAKVKNKNYYSKWSPKKGVKIK